MGAVAAYLLYNHVEPLPIHAPCWHCCRTCDSPQLGCTLVPSWRIRDAISTRGHRTFEAIHAHAQSRPWRCVFDCDNPTEQVDELALGRPELRVKLGRVVFEQQRPDWLRTDSDAFDALLEVRGDLPGDALQALLLPTVDSREGDAEDVELTYPRRVLAVDVADEQESEPIVATRPERGD